MNEALCSMLCEQPQWSFNPYFNEHIIFNTDGTGELWCVIDMTYIFAVNLQWKIILPTTKAESKAQEPTPQTLGTLHLEITLHTSVAKSYPAAHIPGWTSPNEHYLSKAAFQPRCFTVTLEKGRFIPDPYIGTIDMQHNPQ
ncbi:hypothetical protein Slin15195_G099650 [Septoria linicola]|uniref:Uncharacterized protein n=1 Tax=Septoria linicola TaxID=215465 RepID=A0A9Q9B3P4_9PEZI|nr:hypothetical protein Slin15195_G099650 [Septoria linicola]